MNLPQPKTEHPYRVSNQQMIGFIFLLAKNPQMLGVFLMMVQYIKDNPKITLKEVQAEFDRISLSISR